HGELYERPEGHAQRQRGVGLQVHGLDGSVLGDGQMLGHHERASDGRRHVLAEVGRSTEGLNNAAARGRAWIRTFELDLARELDQGGSWADCASGLASSAASAYPRGTS